MKLLVIGTDKSIFERGSAARSRIEAYGRLFDELHIVIYTPSGFAEEKINSGVTLYPTNSSLVLSRPFDAVRIGRKIIEERGIDLVSAQDPAESGLSGWLLKKRTGLLLHIQIHADIFSPFFRKNFWKERLRYWLARFIIPHADLIRVVSERVRQSVETRNPRLRRPALRRWLRQGEGFGGQAKPETRITVLPIFVDRAKIAETKPGFDLREKYRQFDFIILMVARLVLEKNIPLAIAAFAELLNEFPKSGLVIVGDGPERRNLEFKIENLKLSGRVWLEGWQDNLVSYYKGVDLYLLTSNFEGYGRTVVEAAAAGLPVVMTDVGVAGEIIRDGETGRVVPVSDRSALVRAILDARLSPVKSKEMAEKARQLVLSLPPRTWEEYLKAYKSSLGF